MKIFAIKRVLLFVLITHLLGAGICGFDVLRPATTDEWMEFVTIFRFDPFDEQLSPEDKLTRIQNTLSYMDNEVINSSKYSFSDNGPQKLQETRVKRERAGYLAWRFGFGQLAAALPPIFFV